MNAPATATNAAMHMRNVCLLVIIISLPTAVLNLGDPPRVSVTFWRLVGFSL